IVLIGVSVIQFLGGNVLEPSLMGKSLNVSPLAIILSLVAWGYLWGIAGMFLCVPITVIAMIVLYNFENTRWLALLLSQDGSCGSARPRRASRRHDAGGDRGAARQDCVRAT